MTIAIDCEQIVNDIIFYILTTPAHFENHNKQKWTGKTKDLPSLILEISRALIFEFSDEEFRSNCAEILARKTNDDHLTPVAKNIILENLDRELNVVSILHHFFPIVQRFNSKDRAEFDVKFLPRLLEIYKKTLGQT